MKAEQDAVIAALTAAWPQGRVYNVGAVPASPVTPYVVVSVASGTPAKYRLGSKVSSSLFRAVIQNFGKSYGETSFAAEKADAALLDKRITAAHTPCRREVATSVIRDPDGGSLLMTVHTYTFTTTV